MKLTFVEEYGIEGTFNSIRCFSENRVYLNTNLLVETSYVLIILKSEQLVEEFDDLIMTLHIRKDGK